MIIYAARSWKKYLLERNLMMCKTYYTITTEQINDFIYILFIYIKYIYIYIYIICEGILLSKTRV